MVPTIWAQKDKKANFYRMIFILATGKIRFKLGSPQVVDYVTRANVLLMSPIVLFVKISGLVYRLFQP